MMDSACNPLQTQQEKLENINALTNRISQKKIDATPKYISDFEKGYAASSKQGCLKVTQGLGYDSFAELIDAANNIQTVKAAILGPAVGQLRSQLQLSPMDLAKLVGISHHTLRKFERGYAIAPYIQYAIISALGYDSQQEVVDKAQEETVTHQDIAKIAAAARKARNLTEIELAARIDPSSDQTQHTYFSHRIKEFENGKRHFSLNQLERISAVLGEPLLHAAIPKWQKTITALSSPAVKNKAFDWKELADTIKTLRVAAGIDHEEFAKKIGINPSALQRFEEGYIRLPISTRAAIFQVLGCDSLPQAIEKAKAIKTASNMPLPLITQTANSEKMEPRTKLLIPRTPQSWLGSLIADAENAPTNTDNHSTRSGRSI